MNWQIDPAASDWEADWEGTRRWQLRYFRAMPLREKILALEEMEELVQRLGNSARKAPLPRVSP